MKTLTEDLPSETPAEFSRRLTRLEYLAREACPNNQEFTVGLFRAKQAGMTYREALESVIRERNGGAD